MDNNSWRSSYARQSLQFKYPKQEEKVTLNDFINVVPKAIKLRQVLLDQELGVINPAQDDPVMALFRYVEL